MPTDVPITRQTVGSFSPLQAQYSGLPGRVQQQISQGLMDEGAQISQQSQKLYLMQTSTTMKQELARIEQENLGNPDAMEANFTAFKKGYFEKIQGDTNRALLEDQYASETMPYLRRAQSTKRERIDNESATTGLLLVNKSKENIVKNGGGVFSKDPGAVFDAGRNIATQAETIQQVADMTKSDGSPLWTPQQRATFLDIPDASMHEIAALSWAQRPDAEKLSIVESSMQNNGAPADKGADTVKPYDRKKIQQLRDLVDKPSQYDDTFKAAAQQYGLDWKELKLRAAAESGLNPNALGPKTEYGQSGGIMQLTEDTAKSLGVKNRNDPTEAIFGGAKLLAEHMKEAGGDKTTIDKLYYGGNDRGKWGKNTEQYAENLRAVRAGGAGETGTEFDYLSPAYKVRAYDEARDVMNINAMKFATPKERADIVTASGSDKVLAASIKINEALKTDPAAYVSQSPEVQVALTSYASSKSADDFKQYVVSSMSAQSKMGVPDYARKILSKPQAEGTVSEVMNGFSNAQDVHEKMQGLQAQYGEFWPQAFQELQSAKLPPAAMVLGTMNYATQRPFGRLLSQGISEGADNVMSAVGPDAKKEINKALADQLDNFREATQRAQGGTAVINAFTDATGVLAAKLMQTQGLSADEAVKQAAGAVANDYYDYHGTYKVPKNVEIGAVMEGADKVLEGLKGPLITPKGGKYETDAYLANVRAYGYWVNTPEDNGIILKDSAGNYVQMSDGKYLRYTYDELAVAGSEYKKTRDQKEFNLRNANRGAQ